MVRLIVSLLSLISLLGVIEMGAGALPRPLVAAVYYTWYSTPTGAGGYFQHWDTPNASTLHPDGCSASRIVFPPAIREIDSFCYPLIGPYDSMDKEVVRWHIRLAKAAGIDAFLVDWWGSASWQNPVGWTYNVFLKTVLPVAEEENFKVALFDETPQFISDFESVKTSIATYLTQFKNSPAYLKIDNQPVFALYQAGAGKMTAAQVTDLISSVQTSVGPVYWILCQMRARWNSSAQIEIFTPSDFLAIPSLDAVMGYAMFSTWSFYTYADLAPRYKFWADMVHAAGKKVMIPVHPGMDNRKLGTSKTEPGIPRNNGKALRDFWDAALYAGADMICITSWNEWPESTVVEPSLSWPDPALYLKIIAEKQGKKVFIAPPLPSSEHIDPAMAEFINNKSYNITPR